MNYTLNNIPERTQKPRNSGITMVMDKGLSIREIEDFLEVSGTHTDIVKLGWATSYVTPNLDKKLQVYKEAGIPTYFGGTLFEAFAIRNQFDDYRRVLDKYGMQYAEVSDGSMDIPHDEKCEYIRKLSEQVTVISEVGSKDAAKIFAPYKWIALMKAEIEAGRNPRDAKVMLAKEITARFHSATAADAAEQDFINRSKGGIPDAIDEISLPLGEGGAAIGIGALLKSAGLAASSGEGNRLIDGGGVRIDSNGVSDKGLKLGAGTYVLQVGKRKFARVTLS